MMTQIEIEKTSEVESAIATLRKHITPRSVRNGILAWWQRYHAANPTTPANPPRVVQRSLSVPWEDLCRVMQADRYRRDAEQTIINFAKWIEIETASKPEPVHEAGCTVESADWQAQQVIAYLDTDLARRLREHCHLTDQAFSDVVAEALDAHLLPEAINAQPAGPAKMAPKPEAGNDAVVKSVRNAADRWVLLLDFLHSEPFASYLYRGKIYRKEVAKVAKPCNYCLRMILVCDPVYLENVPPQAGESGWSVCVDCMAKGESK